MDLLGAISGIFRSVLSVITLGLSKKLELRMAVDKAASKLDSDLKALGELLPRARQSRQRITSANHQTGALLASEQEYEGDYKIAQGHIAKAPLSRDISGLSLKTLESTLSEFYKIDLEIQKLRERYERSLAEDDRERKESRALFSSSYTARRPRRRRLLRASLLRYGLGVRQNTRPRIQRV
jgi:hypothetical protein